MTGPADNVGKLMDKIASGMSMPQATGKDAAGRKQYRYHPDWRAERDSTKYYRMLAFAAVLPAIRKRTRRDMMGPANCRPRVIATVVELLARTYIRIGNE